MSGQKVKRGPPPSSTETKGGGLLRRRQTSDLLEYWREHANSLTCGLDAFKVQFGDNSLTRVQNHWVRTLSMLHMGQDDIIILKYFSLFVGPYVCLPVQSRAK